MGDWEVRVYLQDARIRWGWPDIGVTSQSAACSLPLPAMCTVTDWLAGNGRCIHIKPLCKPARRRASVRWHNAPSVRTDEAPARAVGATWESGATADGAWRVHAETRRLSSALYWMTLIQLALIGLGLCLCRRCQGCSRTGGWGCGAGGGLCTISNHSIGFQWLIFGWWSASRCSIFRCGTGPLQVLRVRDWSSSWK